jgi:hypothetical protein
MAKRKSYSRLARREEKQSIRRAFIYLLLAVIISVTTLFLGIPVLIRVAVFFAELKGSSLPVEQADVIPPPPPRINTLPEAIKTNQVSLSGTAEAGVSVEIYLNQKNITSVVSNSESKFVTEKIRLEKGKNSIYAIAIDKAGNQSAPSAQSYIWFDNEPPVLTISQPEDGAKFYGEQEKSINLQGKTEPGVSLTLNGRLIIIGSEGEFSTTYSLNEGNNQLKLVARDRAENETEKEITVSYFP